MNLAHEVVEKINSYVSEKCGRDVNIRSRRKSQFISDARRSAVKIIFDKMQGVTISHRHQIIADELKRDRSTIYVLEKGFDDIYKYDKRFRDFHDELHVVCESAGYDSIIEYLEAQVEEIDRLIKAHNAKRTDIIKKMTIYREKKEFTTVKEESNFLESRKKPLW